MPKDFENLYDLNNLDDDELKDLVLQELGEYPNIDVDRIAVTARNGGVTVSGRVGTEQELQQVEQVLTDVLGVPSVQNDLVVDEVVRGERSEAADDAWSEDRAANPRSAEGTIRTSDEAEHLTENIEAEQYGTADPQQATQRGTAYEPPDGPVQEGSTREQH